MPLLTYEEFMRGAHPTDALKLTAENIKVLTRHRKSQTPPGQGMGYLADKIVGAE